MENVFLDILCIIAFIALIMYIHSIEDNIRIRIRRIEERIEEIEEKLKKLEEL